MLGRMLLSAYEIACKVFTSLDGQWYIAVVCMLGRGLGVLFRQYGCFSLVRMLLSAYEIACKVFTSLDGQWYIAVMCMLGRGLGSFVQAVRMLLSSTDASLCV